MEALKILVVDDEPRMRKLVKDFFDCQRFSSDRSRGWRTGDRYFL